MPLESELDHVPLRLTRNNGNDRAEKFSNSGTFLGKWGSYGLGNAESHDPYGLAIGPAGGVYVGEDTNNRVQLFGPQSVPATMTSWGRVKSVYR